MKKLYFILLGLSGLFSGVCAQTSLMVISSDSAPATLLVSDSSRIQFGEGKMTVSEKGVLVNSFAINKIQELWFNLADDIKEVTRDGETQESLGLYRRGNRLLVTGIHTNCTGLLYNEEGLLLKKEVINEQKPFEMGNLRSGIYLLKVGRQTIKFNYR